MAIIRMIETTVPSDQSATAERNWKEKCAPLMIKQPGCVSEELLRCKETPGKYISYSEWDSEQSIQIYLQSADHQEIKRHNRNITGAQVFVSHYELVG